jgi:hypothetical protein
MRTRQPLSALRYALLAVAALLSPAIAPSAGAQEPDEPLERRIERLEAQVEALSEQLAAGADSAEIENIRKQIDAITRELEAMRLGDDLVARADTIGFGLGPAASKVYRGSQGVSIGGYGEFIYTNPSSTREDGTPSGASSQVDALRGVFYVGYKFDDRFLFNSEVEIEHGSTSESGSVSLEFAYLDWRFKGLQGSTGARGGLVLLPMGFINELHEPPTYLGVSRPETERRIIPTTWRELGIGMFGTAGDFDWRAFVVNGLDGSGFDGSGLRGGRQKGSKALAEDFALSARVDWNGVPGLLLGLSGYYGGSGQGVEDPGSPGETIGASTLIVEGHAGYRWRGFDLRGLFAISTVDDAAALNAANGLTGDESIGERLTGWYLQAGYDVLRPARTGVQLLPYLRYEKIDTQAEVPEGFAADPANDQSLVTLGAQVLPIPNIAVKLDYTLVSNEAQTGTDRLSASLSYMF